MPPVPDPTDPPEWVRVPVSVLLGIRDLAASVDGLNHRVAAIETRLDRHVEDERPALELARRFADRALAESTEIAGEAAGGALAVRAVRKAEDQREAEIRALWWSRGRQGLYAAGVILAIALIYLAGRYAPGLLEVPHAP